MGVYFRGLWIFQFSREKFSRIWISDLTRGNNFSQIVCTVFESNKSRKPFGRFRYAVCKFNNVKKLEVNFCGNLLEGVCFHGI